MRRAGWLVAATLCSAAAAVSGYELFDPGRPLNVKFWTSLLIGTAVLAVLAVQRVAAKPWSGGTSAEPGAAPDRGGDSGSGNS
jgi:hypothetical protein